MCARIKEIIIKEISGSYGKSFRSFSWLRTIVTMHDVRKWRSESRQRHCPKCGTLTNANGASSGLRNQYGPLYNYHCKNCGHKWLN